MIAFIDGILKHKSPTEVVVDVHGIGYAVHIPLSTYAKLGDIGRPVSLFTHLQMREDAMQLFGFATSEERQWFRMLLSVSGIGPRLAQGILSGIDVQELHDHIVQGEAAALTSIPGIGKKTAERLIVELRDKASKITFEGSAAAMAGTSSSALRSEALRPWFLSVLRNKRQKNRSRLRFPKTNPFPLLKNSLNRLFGMPGENNIG